MLQKQATPDIREKIAELVRVRALKKETEEREAELKVNILEYVDNQEGSIKHNATLLALVKEKMRTGIDSTLLKTNFPEAAAACAKSSVYLQVECV